MAQRQLHEAASENEIIPAADIEAPAPLPAAAAGRLASRKVALILELCEGGTLSEHVSARGQLKPIEILAIVHDIATGLAHLHSLGVIHRDLKPANLLIQRGRVKLSDLGLSRERKEGQSHLTVTRIGGTPHYSAPESFLGSKLTSKADIYSLACVAYELATGHVPWAELRDEKSDQAMFQIILQVAIKGKR